MATVACGSREDSGHASLRTSAPSVLESTRTHSSWMGP